MFKGKANEKFDPEDRFIIKCYQLVEGSTDETNLLDTVEMKFKDEGWLVLDLTKAVKKWQLDYHTNQGLMVKIVRSDQDLELLPVAIGLTTNRDSPPNKEVSTL